MGCSNSKAGRTRAGPAAAAPASAFPVTRAEQASAFERELVGVLQVMESVPHGSDSGGEHGTRIDAGEKLSLPLNPLAVQLAQQYRQRRDDLLTEQRREQHEVVEQREEEKARKRAGALGNRAPAAAAAAAAGDASTHHAAAESTGGAPLQQQQFTVLANKDLEQARAVDFTADKVARTVKLFAGWVATDVQAMNQRQTEEEAKTTRRSKPDPAHDTQPGEGAWDCEVALELRGADTAADAVLQDACDALETRLAAETGARGGERHAEEAAKGRCKKQGGGEGGCGVVYVNAVFRFKLEDSYDRKQPWQMEICFFFVP